MRERGFRVLAAALAVLVSFGTASAAENTQEQTYPGVTRPKEDRSLPFAFPGIVRKVLVKEGDAVTAGQAMLVLDDRIDQKELEKAEIEAKSELKLRYSEQERDLKKVQQERLEELLKQNAAASQSEVEAARLEAQLAQVRVDISHEELQTKRLDADTRRIKLELATLTSPINGIVRMVNVKEGEYADPQQSANRPVVQVVQIDPLKVEVHLPTMMVSHLKLGQELLVSYPDESGKPHRAKITFFDPVADAASGMQRVHLELPNPEGRKAGWQVSVQVPQKQ